MPDKVFVERLGAAQRLFQAPPFVHEGGRHGQHVIVERRHRSNGHVHALVKTGAPRPPAATRHWRFRIEERQPFVADKIGGGEKPAAAVFRDFKKAKGRLAQEICRFHLCAADFAGADGAIDRGMPAHGRRKKKRVDRIARSIHGAQRHVGGVPQSVKEIRGLGLNLCRKHAVHRLLAYGAKIAVQLPQLIDKERIRSGGRWLTLFHDVSVPRDALRDEPVQKFLTSHGKHTLETR